MTDITLAAAKKLHLETFFIDTHADTPQRFVDEGWEFTDPALNGGHISLPTARAGGLDAEFFAIWAEPTQWKGQYAHRTLQLIDGVLEQIRKHANEMSLCTNVQEILESKAVGKFCALMGIEGGHSIEADLGLLRIFYTLGVRYMTLTWSNSNEWADSSGDLDDPSVPHHNGLSEFGRDVVREMNRLGMMVDVSHVSDKTFWDVMDTSTSPIIASHSSARALTAAPRNLTDEMMRAIAKKDGVVMVNFFPAFIDEAWRSAWNEQRSERMTAYQALEAEFHAKKLPVPYFEFLKIDQTFARAFPRAPLSSLIDHFDHAIRIAGIDHVGFGTDFDGFATLPEGIDSAADLPKISAAPLERGRSEDDLKKLLGSNLLRVFGEVERLSNLAS